VRAQGRYFLPRSAICVDAALELSADGGTLLVRGPDGVLAQAPAGSVIATSRLGNLRRKLELPDGSGFETDDNDAIDALLKPHDSLLHRLEKSWRVVLASVLFAAVAAALFVFYGVPATAGWLARRTPASVASFTSRQTLDAIDGRLLKPTRLTAAQQQRLQQLFRRTALAAPRGEAGYRLLLRDAPLIGPNAFALPGGEVVVTDQLASLARSDAELEGVIAHEMSHVDRAHGLQRVYQASLVPAAIAFITGDATQVGHIATILPGVLLQSAYSREFEQQADDDAAVQLRRMGVDPAALGDLLQRIEAKMCGKDGCLPSWLGSHPATAARAARLRGR
jgi:Zn-dependent protease with chaperone function